MKRKILNLGLLGISMICILYSCENQNKQQIAKTNSSKDSIEEVIKPGFESEYFNNSIDVASLKTTDFVLSMDKMFDSTKNIIYAPTVLFAWDELLKGIHAKSVKPIENHEDFNLLRTTKSHKNTLEKGEYITKVEYNINAIKTTAYFKKDLPFRIKYDVIDAFKFENKKVQGFGLRNGADLYDYDFEIIYYYDDNEFAIRMIPTCSENEIILIKGDKKSTKFSEVISNLNKNMALAKKLKKTKESWKLNFSYMDVLTIPKISFRLKKNYENFRYLAFYTSSNAIWTFEYITQMNAFRLDENGAVVESYAEMAAETPAMHNEPKPKNLIFDTDFYVIVKKRNQTNPFFAIKIINDELLIPATKKQ